MTNRSLPIRDVVRISTGERITPALIEGPEHDWDFSHWYSAGSLKKDGTPKQVGREPRGWGYLGGRYADFAYYETEREVKAFTIRARITYLDQELTEAKDRLRSLYYEEKK